MPELLFHGAAREVTGSLHMLHVDGRWVALDCGLFQGRRAEAEEKNRAWPMPPADIAAVVLSHAHMDHAGRLPRLVRDGFAGPIFCTPATRDLLAVMLADSAHVQEEDAHFISKRRRKRGLPPIEPLYDYDDVLAALKLIQSVSYDRWFPVVPGLLACFLDAGHMLGSAYVRLAFGKATDGSEANTLLYTGDVGKRDKPILRDPAPFPADDTLICESTYGARTSEPVEHAKELMHAVIVRTLKRRGKVIVPSFAVGRTQTIVYTLHERMVAGRLPRIPVFIDSPLAVNATEVFKLHPECYDAEARAFHLVTGDILGNGCCTYVRTVDQSKALNYRKEPCIIIAGSGMIEAGRIRHHIHNTIEDERNTILIAGFQAAHTLGRRLADGARRITLFHDELDVRAEVVQIHGFSGHADQPELLALLAPQAHAARHLILVHGEQEQVETLADKSRALGYRDVRIGTRGERLAL
ncbi:MAG: MBL fold metallo-hydrolase [Planctomycetota bacterium]